MGAKTERVIVGICILVIALCVLMLATGCATGKTKVVYDRVEVPKPYWDPPDARPLPQKPSLQTDSLTIEAAEADPTAALVMVGQDLALVLGDNELLRHLYQELVQLIVSKPISPPPSDGPISPGG